MASKRTLTLPAMIEAHEGELLADWLKLLKASGSSAGGRIKDAELETECREFLAALPRAIGVGDLADLQNSPFERVRELLAEMSRSRATQGFSPTETATFVFSLKRPILEQIRREFPNDAQAVIDESAILNQVLDQLGLYTMETYQKSREAVVLRQQQEILELSTPVVKLWDGILALPLIGTLDSARTQVVMESLLQKIVDHDRLLHLLTHDTDPVHRRPGMFMTDALEFRDQWESKLLRTAAWSPRY